MTALWPKMKMRNLFAALLVFCLTSCASYERAINPTNVGQIRPGITTESDLLQLFGYPDTRWTGMHGSVALDWFRSISPNPAGYLPIAGQFLGGLDLEVQQLSVLIGPSGRVASFSVYDSNGAVKSEKTHLEFTGSYRPSK